MNSEDLGFTYMVTARGEVRISRHGTVVTILRGDVARRLVARLTGAGPAAIQQALARVTGNYRRGNEKSAGRKKGSA